MFKAIHYTIVATVHFSARKLCTLARIKGTWFNSRSFARAPTLRFAPAHHPMVVTARENYAVSQP